MIKFIYKIASYVHCWFKEHIKTMPLKTGLGQLNTYPCLLYILNKPRSVFSIIYIDDTLSIRD